MTVPPQGGPRLLTPRGPQPPSAVLITCDQCGHQILLHPDAVPMAAQRHEAACIGPMLRAVIASLGIHAGVVTIPPDEVQS